MFLNDSLSVLIGLPRIYNLLFYVSHFILQVTEPFLSCTLKQREQHFLKKETESRSDTPGSFIRIVSTFRGAGASCLSQPSVCRVHVGSLCAGEIPPAASPLHIWDVRRVCHSPAGSDRGLTQFHVHPLPF